MKAKTLLVSMLLIVAACCSFPQVVAAQAAKSYKAMAVDVLREVNKHRAKLGLKPMVMKDAISSYAEEHSRNMGNRTVPFGHNGMDERVKKASKDMKQDASAWAENVASGQNSAEGVVAMWLTSTGHRENIEGDYNQTGIGIAKGTNGSLYFTQIFIRKRK